MKRDSTLVLLVLNEIDGLRMVWDDLPLDEFARVVAVDGGSTDGSRELDSDPASKRSPMIRSLGSETTLFPALE